jgi:hypothetical protein
MSYSKLVSIRRSTVLSLPLSKTSLPQPSYNEAGVLPTLDQLIKRTQGKHSSLFCFSITEKEKKFSKIVTKGQCYKTFFVRDLRISVLS